MGWVLQIKFRATLRPRNQSLIKKDSTKAVPRLTMAGGVDRSINITMEDSSDPLECTDINLQTYLWSFHGADTRVASSRVSPNKDEAGRIFDHAGLQDAHAKNAHLVNFQDLEHGKDQAWYDSSLFVSDLFVVPVHGRISSC
jgi:hypothetical protein